MKMIYKHTRIISASKGENLRYKQHNHSCNPNIKNKSLVNEQQ